MARKIVEQFALVTIAPGQPRSRRWRESRSSESALISGISRGTSGSTRKAEALEKTHLPCRAQAGSSSRAAAASSAENTKRHGRSESAGTRLIDAIRSGRGEESLQRVACP